MDALTVIAFCSALLLLVMVALGVMVWLILDLWRAL
jgi:hypothetical protein